MLFLEGCSGIASRDTADPPIRRQHSCSGAAFYADPWWMGSHCSAQHYLPSRPKAAPCSVGAWQFATVVWHAASFTWPASSSIVCGWWPQIRKAMLMRWPRSSVCAQQFLQQQLTTSSLQVTKLYLDTGAMPWWSGLRLKIEPSSCYRLLVCCITHGSAMEAATSANPCLFLLRHCKVILDGVPD